MRRFLPCAFLAAFALLASSARADNAGQADLDKATDLKITAETGEDLGEVIRLCESALAAGLDDQNREFAESLYVGTLVQRGSLFAAAIFDKTPPDPRWARLRRLALEDLEKAFKIQPDLPEALVIKARLLALPGGDPKEARVALTKAIDLSADAPLDRAKALIYRANLSENPDDRMADYNEAVRLAPSDEEIVRARGLLLLLQGKLDDSIKDFDTALAIDPKQADVHEARGVALFMLKKYDDALEAFDKAVELSPESPMPYMHRARIHALKGDSPAAIGQLDEALKAEPDNLAVLLLRARIHQQAGDVEAAKADIDSALKQRPGLTPALEMRAIISAGAGEYAQAISDLEELRKAAPKNSLLLSQLGMLYSADKKPRKAVEAFTAAVAADGKSWIALRGRADANLSIGRQADAIADYETAIKLNPDDSGLLNNLAWVLATSPDDKLRDGKRAIEVAEQACRLTDYKAPHILSTLAAAHAEAGDFETARKWSKQAVELSDDDVKPQLEAELKSYDEKKPWRELQQDGEAEATSEKPGSPFKPESPDDEPKNDREASGELRREIAVVQFAAYKRAKAYSAPPKMTIDPAKTYIATFKTSKGEVVCELFAKDAPKTVNNFVFLTREGFYDGLKFHRVIPDFMVQGGDPEGTGRGGPGYEFEDEVRGNPRRHQVGSLSMANAGPNTNGSQFFITHIATDWLDGKHTVFGQVTSGQDVVNAIEMGDVIESIKIEEK